MPALLGRRVVRTVGVSDIRQAGYGDKGYRHPVAHRCQYGDCLLGSACYMMIQTMDNTTLYIDSIAGYVGAGTAWRFLKDIATQVSARHGCGQCCGNIVPENIAIQGSGFVLQERTFPATPGSASTADMMQDDIWDIGAALFYLLMGNRLFWTQDRRRQTAGTPLPTLSLAMFPPELNELMQRCISHLPACRPTASEIAATATQQMTVCAQRPRRLKSPGSPGRANTISDERLWPEEMKRFVVILLLVMQGILAAGTASAQHFTLTQEMRNLVQHIGQLRDGDTRTAAIDALEKDKEWTVMDEILTTDGYNGLTMEPVFGLYRIGVDIFARRQADNMRVHAGNHFRHGADPSFRYSLVDVVVKKNSRIAFPITGREGIQVLAVTAYNKESRISVNVTCSAKMRIQYYEEDGVHYFKIDNGRLQKSDTLTLTITNDGPADVSCAIVNHNSRINR